MIFGMYGKTCWVFFSSQILRDDFCRSYQYPGYLVMKNLNAKMRDLNKYKFYLNEIKNDTSESHTIVLKFMKDRPLSLTLACVS